MERISVTQAARQLSDLLNRVAYQGQSFELERGNKVVAQLTPVAKPAGGVPIEKLNQLFAELPALDDDFANDVNSTNEALPLESDPWA